MPKSYITTAERLAADDMHKDKLMLGAIEKYVALKDVSYRDVANALSFGRWSIFHAPLA